MPGHQAGTSLAMEQGMQHVLRRIGDLGRVVVVGALSYAALIVSLRVSGAERYRSSMLSTSR